RADCQSCAYAGGARRADRRHARSRDAAPQGSRLRRRDPLPPRRHRIRRPRSLARTRPQGGGPGSLHAGLGRGTGGDAAPQRPAHALASCILGDAPYAGRMTLSFDFYFSFRCPYSYLATPQVERLMAQYDIAPRMRIVTPIAMRIPGFFKTVNPMWPP